ncbi:MAG: glycosyltransferase, partial [Candidatus Dadabacteria bacterium]
LLLSQNFLCHLTVIKSDLVREIGGFRKGYEGAQDWDLSLRAIEKLKDNQIVHIPFILYHWRVIPDSTAMSINFKPYALTAGKKAIEDHLKRTNKQGKVDILEELSHYRVRFKLAKDLPLVSLIILTKDKKELLKPCIESILEKTTYPHYEIIVIDNGSSEKESLEYLEEIKKNKKIRVFRKECPFNFSALNNWAVSKCKGEVIGLLNNDLEVINGEWLSEMVAELLQPKVGVVGARLWYPNDVIQHAGVILGIGGIAGHAHKGLPKGNPGYFNRGCLTQWFSAVTAACLITYRSVYKEVGGLDEGVLAVAFNDIDFCLKVGKAGYKIVWTSYAELYHYESASRGYESTPQKFARFEREVSVMKERWGEILENDPFYNPNLTLTSENFALAFPPRVKKPWLRLAEKASAEKVRVSMG